MLAIIFVFAVCLATDSFKENRRLQEENAALLRMLRALTTEGGTEAKVSQHPSGGSVPQCNPGFSGVFDRSIGWTTNWACADKCGGGPYTDDYCNCICKPDTEAKVSSNLPPHPECPRGYTGELSVFIGWNTNHPCSSKCSGGPYTDDDCNCICKPDVCEIQENIDFTGMDIHSIDNVMSAEDCARECENYGGCEAWTWGKKPDQTYTNRCHLKSQTLYSQIDDCCDSGFKNACN